jgi:hypothetical protein
VTSHIHAIPLPDGTCGTARVRCPTCALPVSLTARDGVLRVAGHDVPAAMGEGRCSGSLAELGKVETGKE